MPSSNSPASPPTPTGVTPSVQTRSPSASRRQWSSWDRSMPLHYDLTLRIDPSLPGPSHIGQKAAKVFAVDSDSVTAPATDHTNIVATLPPLSTWPRRKWDRQPIARHANFSLRHHVRFGNTGSPTALHRYIAMYQTFADPNAHSDVHLRIYWSHADDPRGLYGVQSYLMHAYMNATGSTHYPVILGGDWKLMAFHMLVHMYDTSPEDVQWFALGAEGTVWFPRQVQALVTSLDVDPMQTYVYMGEVSESKDRQRTHGNMAGAGGGMLISRALAAQLHKHHAWCVQHLAKGDPGFFGADLIKACIDAVAVKVGIPAGVPLTRVPMFNPLELMGQGWPSGRAYLSARVSRAPPVTLSDLENLPPLFSSGMLTRMLAVHDWWHLVEQMPRTLMFRRFFVHVRGRDVGREATIVVTFGLHVRVYERVVTDVDHPVDFDGPITKDPEMWGADWLTENAQVSATNKWTWPNEETSFTDFWIHEYDERDGGLTVYLEEGNRAKFGIRAKCEGAGEGNVLTLCSIPEVVDGWVQ
ncbi:hypothetical protein BCR44DRAFT_1439273 [Catenaria anguillulae PL171]|uniref:Uncharacterized protein n=1 Tax=Catenaria anguillulae PL171 TaxID=765915 RepID=A0A1Y2HEJ1_9FUNG|nr:hypothetical protein BCR44DRAFT_1439273 [Catenaria anguillulae PL171]